MMTPSIFFYVFISDFEYKGISILMKPWSGEKRKWWQDILMFILTRAVTAAAVHLQHCEKTWGIIIIFYFQKKYYLQFQRHLSSGIIVIQINFAK